MERAKAAGYVVPVGCECGRRSDNLCHRLLHCQKTEDLRATHYSDAELQRLRGSLPKPLFTSWVPAGP
eukprot:8088193-Pyramimonas_sp.AAC.1